MNTHINLPVADLARSRAFFEALGFSFNDAWSDDTALSMPIGESSFAMLLTHEKYRTFTDKDIADTTKTSQVLIGLQLESRSEVEAIMNAATANGGAETRPPEDHGFMYGHAFSDPDGHVWEPFWMDPSAMGGGE